MRCTVSGAFGGVCGLFTAARGGKGSGSTRALDGGIDFSFQSEKYGDTDLISASAE